MNTKKRPKLIVIDCDGVLYHPRELDVNAMLSAFNSACDELCIPDEKFIIIDGKIETKSIGGSYNHILSAANKANITPETFINKVIDFIDYSNISTDTDNVLELIHKLSQKYKVCICTNNTLPHVNKVLKAKFNINANMLPFEVFDATFAEKGGIYYPKQSDIFVEKLEDHFGIKATDFLWIDDDTTVTNAVTDLGSQFELVTTKHCLKDILSNFLR
jgi:FMN phosphatase YigB (HAD superfamily)